MSGLNASMGAASGDVLDAGFAKLQGKDFSYIMQSYEITVGRSTKKEKVDLDLSALAGDKYVYGRHARIFYDFQHRSFALEVLDQRGCYVRKVLHRPGDSPIKLKSQDAIQIGHTQFYFLLPPRSIFATSAVVGTQSQLMSSSGKLPARSDFYASRDNGHGGANCGNEIIVGTGTQGLFTVPIKISSAEVSTGPIKVETLGIPNEHAKKIEIRMANKVEDNMRLLLEEESDLISCVTTMVSNHCNASGRQWMPVEQLHAELIEHLSTIWPQSKVQKYLAPEDGSSTGTAETPWHRLLELLKNYPEKFLMSSMSRGTITSEFVSLVCLAHKFCCPEVAQIIAMSKNKK